MRERILGLLGLMRRASAVSPGEDQAGDAVKAGKAKLLLFSADVADNARRKAENLSNGRNVQLVPLPFDRGELPALPGAHDAADEAAGRPVAGGLRRDCAASTATQRESGQKKGPKGVETSRYKED